MARIKRIPAGRRTSTARQRQIQHEERKLDDALRDSFPASDPVSFLEPCPADEPVDTKPVNRRG